MLEMYQPGSALELFLKKTNKVNINFCLNGFVRCELLTSTTDGAVNKFSCYVKVPTDISRRVIG